MRRRSIGFGWLPCLHKLEISSSSCLHLDLLPLFYEVYVKGTWRQKQSPGYFVMRGRNSSPIPLVTWRKLVEISIFSEHFCCCNLTIWITYIFWGMIWTIEFFWNASTLPYFNEKKLFTKFEIVSDDLWFGVRLLKLAKSPFARLKMYDSV